MSSKVGRHPLDSVVGKVFQVEGPNRSVLAENRKNTEKGLTEPNSIKGLGTEVWAGLKETNKKW